MSLEASLTAERDAILSQLGTTSLNPITSSYRGRPANSDRSISPHRFGANYRSVSRGRSSSRKRQLSSAGSHNEDFEYKWSILNHDPSERFIKPRNQSITSPTTNFLTNATTSPQMAPTQIPASVPNIAISTIGTTTNTSNTGTHDFIESNVELSDDLDSDDLSEEEQISDDEGDFDFDINEVCLPNFKISITEYYKKRSGQGYLTLIEAEKSAELKEQSRQNKRIREENIENKAKELRELTEVLSLKKALESARESGSDIPKETVTSVLEKLRQFGIKDPHRIQVKELVELENKKEKVYKTYKELLVEKTGKNGNGSSKGQWNFLDLGCLEEKQISISEMNTNKETLRASRTLTLGDFFHKSRKNSNSGSDDKTGCDAKNNNDNDDNNNNNNNNNNNSNDNGDYNNDNNNNSSTDGLNKKAKDIDSYLIYMDLAQDSLNSLQYTIGTVVKSGDVLYVINSVDDEEDIEYYKKQCDKLTELVSNYLKLISDDDFKLHVVVETTHHKYPKHFVNELIRHLKPNLFVVAYGLLQKELSNYISNVPILILKKRSKTKKTYR